MPSLDQVDIAVKRALVQTVWLTKNKFDDVENRYQRHLAKIRNSKEKASEEKVAAVPSITFTNFDAASKSVTDGNKNTSRNKKKTKKKNDQQQTNPKAEKISESSSVAKGKSSLVDEIARTRQQIKHSLQSCEISDNVQNNQNVSTLEKRLKQLELDNEKLLSVIVKLTENISSLDKRIVTLEKQGGSKTEAKSTPAETKAEDDDNDVDLFASDEEDDAEREKLHNQRVKAYEEKKSKKTAIIAKSNIILDVKPWDDETDMKKMEESVRAIQIDGLIWGAAKLVPLAYGIFKLQISCVVEDDKVSVDDLQEQIEGLEELVQSVDIAAFNKV